MTCPHCDYATAYHGNCCRTLVVLCGDISCWRAYSYCRRCGQGFCTFDQQAGLGDHHHTEMPAGVAGKI